MNCSLVLIIYAFLFVGRRGVFSPAPQKQQQQSNKQQQPFAVIFVLLSPPPPPYDGLGSFRFNSAHDGSYACGKAHTRSRPCLLQFPRSCLERIATIVWLTMVLSRHVHTMDCQKRSCRTHIWKTTEPICEHLWFVAPAITRPDKVAVPVIMSHLFQRALRGE